ncbi:unnamed protein product [Oncorhynchus mykiss]|uniref:Uncharacterized protein n=1 Tax=Oncorhynchus mykiss TaxID=8022 RepID=A0A060WQ78_ONCMY|nr:unnamed protein product [Oncorhynchus mykiss]
MNHQILLCTFSGLGFSGSAHFLIASYLASESYQVLWRGSVSVPRTLTTGVPQISVLVRSSSLYKPSHSALSYPHMVSYHCYADDTQLHFSSPPPF